VNRWAVRIVALLMVLIFLLVFAHMYRTLKMLQGRQPPAPSTSTSTAKP
jgi:hypothetical protein